MNILGLVTQMKFGRLFLAMLMAGVLSSVPVHTNAQTVLARVLDDDDSRPLFGALAYLVNSDGTVLKSALTDSWVGLYLWVYSRDHLGCVLR